MSGTNGARKELLASLVRDHRVAAEEAERWCRAWEKYATEEGLGRGQYFWDAARGWIDAHVSHPVKRKRPKVRR